MKINGNQIRKGNILQYEGGLWRVAKAEAAKTGKSGAYQQVEMKHITLGTKKNVRFRASESVERARLEERAFSYLYTDGDVLILMDLNTYDQIQVPQEIAGDQLIFLTDGMEVSLEFHDEQPLNMTIPAQLTLTVDETEPSIKGQTATSSYKPAVLSNGLKTTVPPFINVGDAIIVDTAEQTYVKRAD